MEAFKLFVEQLTKNIKQAPGWIPLFVLCYFAMPLWTSIISPRWVAFLAIKEHPELAATVVTAALYVIGDALDKVVFPREKDGKQTGWQWLAPRELPRKQEDAQKALSMNKDYYRVAKALLDSADEYSGTWIMVKNESAKFVRSLVVPVVVIALLVLLKTPFLAPEGLFALLPLGGAFVLLLFYGWLKGSHMCDIYAKIQKLTGNTELPYKRVGLDNNLRLFFWKGKLAASGIVQEKVGAANPAQFADGVGGSMKVAGT